MKDMLTRIDTEAPGSTFRVPFFNVSARDTLSPIPLDELTLNASIGITNQNPGW